MFSFHHHPRALIAAGALVATLAATASSEAREPRRQRDTRMRPASTAAQSRSSALAMTGVLNAEFINRVGSNYRLVSITCEIDGVRVCNKTDGLGDRVSLFSRRLSTGNHRWSVVAVYQGSGGVFSYASGFRYDVKNGGEVTVDVDRPTAARILAFESGGPTVPMSQRLRMAIRTQ
jgi:hypothetical protein